jgi:hypothetical protein
MERLKIHLPLKKDRKHWTREEKQMAVRMRYGVEMPSWKTSNRILGLSSSDRLTPELLQ